MGTLIRGRLATPDGQSVGRVIFLHVQSGHETVVLPDSDGRFQTPRLAPGQYRVVYGTRRPLALVPDCEEAVLSETGDGAVEVKEREG